MIWQQLFTAPPSGGCFNRGAITVLDLSPFFKALPCNDIKLARLATSSANAALRCWHRSCRYTVWAFVRSVWVRTSKQVARGSSVVRSASFARWRTT